MNCHRHSKGSYGQVLHGSAKTTHAIRAELQRSKASVAQLAERFGINEKTVLKWRKGRLVEDMPMGPKARRSTVLMPVEEAAIIVLRVQARLPLDDVYIALKDVIPHLTRSSLHRCLQRHDISRLPKSDREKPKKLKDYEIGYFHIDIAKLRYEGGKGFLFVAVDRTSEAGVRTNLSQGHQTGHRRVPQVIDQNHVLQDSYDLDGQWRAFCSARARYKPHFPTHLRANSA